MKTTHIFSWILLTICILACTKEDQQENIWEGNYHGTIVVEMDESSLFQTEMTVNLNWVQGNYYDMQIEGLHLPEGFSIDKQTRLVEVTDTEKTLKGVVTVAMQNQKFQLDVKAFQHQDGLFIQMALPLAQLSLLVEFKEKT